MYHDPSTKQCALNGAAMNDILNGSVNSDVKICNLCQVADPWINDCWVSHVAFDWWHFVKVMGTLRIRNRWGSLLDVGTIDFITVFTVKKNLNSNLEI